MLGQDWDPYLEDISIQYIEIHSLSTELGLLHDRCVILPIEFEYGFHEVVIHRFTFASVRLELGRLAHRCFVAYVLIGSGPILFLESSCRSEGQLF